MPNFRFMHANFADPKLSKHEITLRLSGHRRKLLAAKMGFKLPHQDDGKVEDGLDGRQGREPDRVVMLDRADKAKIERRAALINKRHLSTSGLTHLKTEDVNKLERVRDGVRLARLASEHQADELAASLHAEFPWMGLATEALWHALRQSVRTGDVGLRVPPMLLDGPPGIGKSAWARAVGKLIHVPSVVYEATTENASFGLTGSQRGWGNATPGRLITTILSHQVGNPVVVVDEVEKSGHVGSTKGQAFSLTDALLPLLEPLSASGWSCPYFEVKFDMSYVIWVLTSNDHRRLPQPLLSRCPPIRLRELSTSELATFARREGQRNGLDEISIEAVVEAIERWDQPSLMSLRTVGRMVNRAVQLQAIGFRLN